MLNSLEMTQRVNKTPRSTGGHDSWSCAGFVWFYLVSVVSQHWSRAAKLDAKSVPSFYCPTLVDNRTLNSQLCALGHWKSIHSLSSPPTSLLEEVCKVSCFSIIRWGVCYIHTYIYVWKMGFFVSVQVSLLERAPIGCCALLESIPNGWRSVL